MKNLKTNTGAFWSQERKAFIFLAFVDLWFEYGLYEQRRLRSLGFGIRKTWLSLCLSMLCGCGQSLTLSGPWFSHL